MRECLIVLGLFLMAVAFRSSRKNAMRKIGALGLLFTTFVFCFFLSGNLYLAFLGMSLWFFLPWVEILTRIRHLRVPINNRLRHRELPNPSFFPNAIEAAAGMEEEGFEHVSDSGWEWSGMIQHFRLFWNPEERAIASVCLCEQDDVAFAFLSITSTDCNGNTWRTTNFPFAPTLQCAPKFAWNHVPCEKSCFSQILADHKIFLTKNKVNPDSLLIPNPEDIDAQIDREMQTQIQHNVKAGIIELTGDGHFQYSPKGYLFLWRQYVKDMIRLC